MPFKHHAEHRHHIPKPRYRVTNGPEYDAALRRRGSLTVWFTDEAIAAWQAEPRTTPGGQGNLRYVGRDDLGPDHDVDYVIRFSYPLDEAAKRRAAARLAEERARKEETELLLRQQTANFSADPWLGDRNYRYLIRGAPSLTPALVWDNGYSTAFTFPAMQRLPSLFRVNPDGKEATSDYSVHGDTMIATGTAQLWRLRDGQTVAEILDLGFNPVGKTPGTGTVSPYVRRDVRGANGG